MNKKYALFALAAIVAVGGIIYFGTGANQQASVGNVMNNTASQKAVSAPTPTFPTEGNYPEVAKEVKAYRENLAAVINKVTSGNPGTADKKRVIELEEGGCILVGQIGRAHV